MSGSGWWLHGCMYVKTHWVAHCRFVNFIHLNTCIPQQYVINLCYGLGCLVYSAAAVFKESSVYL